MKSKYIATFLLSLMLFTGCTEDWLELKNPNLQTSETFWNTEEDIMKGVTAAYMGLLYDGTWMRFVPFALNLKADDTRSESPWNVLSLTGKFNLSGDPIMAQWPWTSFYGVICRANQVLMHVDEAKFTSEDKRKQYKGEALFLRAFSYYYLVTFFRNIPLVLRPYETDADLYPEQAPPEDVWALIFDDFAEAAQLLPEVYPEAEKGRATKGAALAFLGKAYLMNKDYANASANLFQVIDSEIYELMDDYARNFTAEPQDENNAESVFEIQMDRNVGGTTLGWVSQPAPDWSKTSAHAITFAPTPFGFGDADATDWIFQEFKKEKNVDGEVDERIIACISFDTTACTMYGTPFRSAFDPTRWNKVFVRKYTNAYSSALPNEYDWRSGINERVMRYAEVLMMYAECQYELGHPDVAAQYIQEVRNRVNLPDITDQIAAMNREDFYNQLSHEKALEFAFEGVRFEDIVRWGWLYDPDKLAELKAHDPEYESYIEGREYFPIPPAELNKNPKYKNNPGW